MPYNPYCSSGGTRPSKPALIGSVAVVLLPSGVSIIMSKSASPDSASVSLPYSVFWQQLDGGTLASLSVRGTALTGQLKEAVTYPPAESEDQTDLANPPITATAFELFEQIKPSSTPSVVFIDQIDAVGRKRRMSGAGGNAELLVEHESLDADTIRRELHLSGSRTSLLEQAA